MLPRLIVGIPTAMVLYFVGAIFGLNGPNWDWWQDAAWGAAVLTLIAAPLAGLKGDRMRRVAASLRRPLVFMGAAGIVVLIAALAVMGNHFNDSYYGSPVWPHALACVGFVGYVMALIAFALRSPASGGRRGKSKPVEKRNA